MQGRLGPKASFEAFGKRGSLGAKAYIVVLGSGQPRKAKQKSRIKVPINTRNNAIRALAGLRFSEIAEIQG